MAVIDAEGRILGRVNAVDAAVVAVVVALFAAAALHLAVFRPDVTIHAQVFGGPLDEAVAAGFVTGATADGGRVILTDAVVAPAGPGTAFIAGKVRILAERLENGYRLGQEFVEEGSPLTLRLPTGVADVRVLVLDDAPSLAWREVPSAGAFVARGVPAPPIPGLAPGRLVALDGTRFLRIHEAAVLPSAPGVADAYLRGEVVEPVGLATLAGTRAQYAPPALRVPLVEDHAAAEAPVEVVTLPVRVAVLRAPPLAPLPPVDSHEVVDGVTLVRVRDAFPVQRWAPPAPSGQAPVEAVAQESWVELEVMAATRGSGYERAGAALFVGGPFRAMLDGGVLEGVVLRLGEAPPGAWREATLRASGLPAAVADRLLPGAVERSAAGAPLAEVADVLSSFGHPDGSRDVVFRARLWTEAGHVKATPLVVGERVELYPGGSPVVAWVEAVAP